MVGASALACTLSSLGLAVSIRTHDMWLDLLLLLDLEHVEIPQLPRSPPHNAFPEDTGRRTLHRAQRTQHVELVPGMHRPDLSGIHGLGSRSPRTEAPPPPFKAITITLFKEQWLLLLGYQMIAKICLLVIPNLINPLV